MRKLLLITTKNFFSFCNTGGIIASRRNFDFLCEYYGKDSIELIIIGNTKGPYKLDSLSFPDEYKVKIYPSVSSNFGAFFVSLFGLKVMTIKTYMDILKYIEKSDADYIFLDGSILGKLVKKTNKERIISFFHNVEASYSWNKVKLQGLIYLLPFLCSFIADLYACKSRYIICLNKRDSEELQRLYGRKADYIMPMSFPDKFCPDLLEYKQKNHLLFVGSLFPPNYDGVIWFIKNILVELPGFSLDIVGRGWEEKKEELSEYKQVNIIGTVDDVSYWYHKYPALVMPIRRGSGIKVKTAEAIMYGKTIFASDEALEGYDVNEIKGIYRCNDAKEYIDNIMSFFTGKEIPLCQDDVRKLYLKKYSSDHLYNCTATFFECIDSGSIH